MTVTRKEDDMEYRMTYVKGVEGNSVYLNDYRIAGPKPWSGGKILKEWNVTKRDIMSRNEI